jgi:medium-chain acyl-[acyl-carrier-protein] hydrolase
MQVDGFKPVWREKFQVRSSDIGYHGIMRVSNLCSYFQEIAGKHAEHLNVGYTHMRAAGMAWVLARLAIEIRKFPSWGEEFYLETWPLGTGRIFYRREYRLLVGEENLISASSFWIPLELLSRRPKIVPIDKAILKANEGRFGIEGSLESIPAVNGEVSETVRVKFSDLDQNKHVNNARYVEWVFDHLGLDLPGNGMPGFFAIEYKQEVRPGDKILLKKIRLADDKTYLVEGFLASTGQVSLRAKIRFQGPGAS